MAFTFHAPYAAPLVAQMQGFYATLSEKDRRRYAALEARRVGYGGITYIAGLLGCSKRTIARGLQELKHLPNDPAGHRDRRVGGGRKKKLSPTPNSPKI